MSCWDEIDLDAPWSWGDGLWTPWLAGEDEDPQEDDEPGEDDDWEWEYDDEDDEEEEADVTEEGDEDEWDEEGNGDEEDEWEYEDDEDEEDQNQEEEGDWEDGEWEYEDEGEDVESEDVVSEDVVSEDVEDGDEEAVPRADTTSLSENGPRGPSDGENAPEVAVLPRADEFKDNLHDDVSDRDGPLEAPGDALPIEDTPVADGDASGDDRVDDGNEEKGEPDADAPSAKDTSEEVVVAGDDSASDAAGEVVDADTQESLPPALESSDPVEDIATNEEAPLHIPLKSDSPAADRTSQTPTRGVDRQVLWLAGILIALLLLALLFSHLRTRRAGEPQVPGVPLALQLTGRAPKTVRVGEPFRVLLAAKNLGKHALDEHAILVRTNDVISAAQGAKPMSVVPSLDAGQHRLMNVMLVAKKPGTHLLDAVTNDKRGLASAGRVWRIHVVSAGTRSIDGAKSKGTQLALSVQTRGPAYARIGRSFVVHGSIENTGGDVLYDLIISFAAMDGVKLKDSDARITVPRLGPGGKVRVKATFVASLAGERTVRLWARDRNNWTAAVSHQIVDVK